MGEMSFIEIATGEKTVIQIDGTIIKEQNPVKLEWCDKCQSWKEKEFGRFDGGQGLSLIWVCLECKR